MFYLGAERSGVKCWRNKTGKWTRTTYNRYDHNETERSNIFHN